jgi:hypothetical protein
MPGMSMTYPTTSLVVGVFLQRLLKDWMVLLKPTKHEKNYYIRAKS